MESRPIVIFGNIGSDAGYWYLGADGKIHHVPGWNPETRQAFKAIEENFAILERAFKAPQVQVNEGLNKGITGAGGASA
ncbi:MAG TPA: hypothetical protein VJP80_06315 [Candidatus Saccharimonadales bacterium]|nr:hypothetical protein [Candidatus Saccharimonadales bacterium]